jgi:hypothetical protein
MPIINAHFDGHAFVPDEPLAIPLPVGVAVEVILPVTATVNETKPEPGKPGKFDDLLRYVGSFPELPTDLSINHDRYIMGENP